MEGTEEMLYAQAMSREGEEGREDRRNAKTKVICKPPLLHRNSFPTPCFCVCQFVLILEDPVTDGSFEAFWTTFSFQKLSLCAAYPNYLRPPLSLPDCRALTFCHSGVLILRVHSAQTLQDVSPKNILSCDHKNQPSPEM